MSPETNTEKPRLNKNQLQAHGIEFNKKIHKIDELDTWLQPICHDITRLQENFPKDTRETFEEELKQFRLHGQDRNDALRYNWCLRPVKNPDYRERENYARPKAKGYHLMPASCELALLGIRRCHTRNENEDKWTQILCEHVFLDFYKVNEDLSPYEQKLNEWELQQNVLWSEFPQWAGLNPKIARITRPKPDLTYAFPVISPNDKIFETPKDNHRVDSFSLPVLGELRNRQKESLISTPTTALYNWATKNKTKPLEAKDLMCFPWAIVEIKRGTAQSVAGDKHIDNKAEARKHEKRTQFCYCQAANASAAGLTLREHLAARARDSSKLRNTRVMFSFTCVGSAIKLWITYREEPGQRNEDSQPWHGKGRIIMVCIWATSLELSWGIIATRMIVKNVKNWVYANIKPQISNWIHGIHQNRLQRCSHTPSGGVAIQRRRAASYEPSGETVAFEKSVSPTLESQHCTPRGRTRPTLPHSQTTPGSFDRRLNKASIPRMQLDGSTEPDGGAYNNNSDEEYASTHTRGWWGSTEDEEEDMSTFIVNDEPSKGGPDSTYEPSSPEDEESGDDGTSSGEDLSWREENGDDYDLSDSERRRHRLNHQSHASRRLEVYCTPTKGYKSCKPAESRSKKDRRRSSRF